MAAFIRTSDHLTVTFDNGSSVTVYPNNPHYKDIVVALNKRDFDTVRRLSSPSVVVQEKIDSVKTRGYNGVELRSGVVYYNNEPIHNTLTNRIVEMANEGFDIAPMCHFLGRLEKNPSYRAVTELFSFLEKGNLPITEDGYFLAYKKVRSDYLDVHSQSVLNKPATLLTAEERASLPVTKNGVTVDIVDGKTVVTMPRNKVNENPNVSCSHGLHFCSRSYLSVFNGERILVLKIDPADVVAIPTDYNETKGRCCRYIIDSELQNQTASIEGTFRPSPSYVPPTEAEDTPSEDDNADTELVHRLDPHDNSVLGTYDIKDAAVNYDLTPSAIRRVARGDRKTAGGWGWAFCPPNSLEWEVSIEEVHHNRAVQNALAAAGDDDDDFDDYGYDDDYDDFGL